MPPVQMFRPALRDWLSILASVPKYLARVSQGKTRRKLEPAAVHGGNMKVLELVLGMKLLGIGLHVGAWARTGHLSD